MGNRNIDPELLNAIRSTIASAHGGRVFLVTDSNVAAIEADLISLLKPQEIIVVPAGEENKTYERAGWIAGKLTVGGATRRSLLICLGGGMVTDLGGFVAAIFKRGIRHINVATTLLGAVDASIGGKTGVDFHGLKNEVGAFHMPIGVFADVGSFASLPPHEMLSGFGEVIKTAFISGSEMTDKVLVTDPLDTNEALLKELCDFCRNEKMRVVKADPKETGLRKVLNLGHTAGHAMEILMMDKDTSVPHGIAVAHGLLVSLVLSNMECGLPSSWVSSYAHWLRTYYPPLPFTCSDYPYLWEIARHDKKNSGVDNCLSFVLMKAPGDLCIDIPIDRHRLEKALDIYQELQGR